MGTKVAPTYATLVLGYLEELMYEKITLEKGSVLLPQDTAGYCRIPQDCPGYRRIVLLPIIFHNKLLLVKNLKVFTRKHLYCHIILSIMFVFSMNHCVKAKTTAG